MDSGGLFTVTGLLTAWIEILSPQHEMDTKKVGRVRSSTMNATGQRSDMKFQVAPLGPTSALAAVPPGDDEDDEDAETPRALGLRRFDGLNDLLATRPAKEDLLRTNILRGKSLLTKATCPTRCRQHKTRLKRSLLRIRSSRRFHSVHSTR